VSTLEERITDAHKRGDQHELRRLQAEYRRGGTPIRYGPPPALTEGSQRRRHSHSSTPLPELRANGPSFTVHLSEGARRAIEDECLEAAFRFAGQSLETGGWLYGLSRARSNSVDICFASGPGRASRHASSSVALTSPELVEDEFDDVLVRARLVRVGDFHTHPGTTDARPSGTDLRAWASWRRELGLNRYVSVIVTAGELGWRVPELHGWVTTKDSSGNLVCEPATIAD
jgi:proteasome lid subunit RPN8/RPN11